jgi:hypothetical protein
MTTIAAKITDRQTFFSMVDELLIINYLFTAQDTNI